MNAAAKVVVLRSDNINSNTPEGLSVSTRSIDLCGVSSTDVYGVSSTDMLLSVFIDSLCS